MKYSEQLGKGSGHSGFMGLPGLLLLFCLWPSCSFAALLTMVNGDHLTGTVESWGKGSFLYKTEYAGIINVDWSKVSTLRTETNVVVLTDDEVLYSGKLRYEPDMGVTLETKDGENIKIEQENIAYINPEDWRLGTAIQQSGQVSFSLKVDRGNADKNEIDLDLSYSARAKYDRFSLFADLEYDHKSGETTKDTWSILGKHDRFVSKKRYYSLNGFIEHDRGKGIDLRYYLGPAIGYQVWESDEKNLQAEWGLYYTSTDLLGEDRNANIGTGWFVNYDQYVYKRVLQVYHRQSAVLSNRENMNFKSKTGLRVPVYAGFLASLELEANWDGETAADSDDTELITRFKLGYGW